jgi:chitin synthase
MGLDSRAASSYGRGGSDYPPSRGISPAGSYANLRQQSLYDPNVPSLPYAPLHGSPMGVPGTLPVMDQRGSYYGSGGGGVGGGSMYGADGRATSVYNDPRASSYSLGMGPAPGQGQGQGPFANHPGMDSRAPSYSIPYNMEPQRNSSYSFQQYTPYPPNQSQDDFRQSSYSLSGQGLLGHPVDSPYAPTPSRSQSQYQLQPQTQSQTQSQSHSRPPSFLPELTPSTSIPLNAGSESIPVADLERSIRRICANADLDQLTKKGVRKQLEDEFGVSLGSRKDEIGRIIEVVLSGKSSRA